MDNDRVVKKFPAEALTAAVAIAHVFSFYSLAAARTDRIQVPAVKLADLPYPHWDAVSGYGKMVRAAPKYCSQLK